MAFLSIFRIVTTDNEEVDKHRGWYRAMDSTRNQSPINVQFPKSKWDSEAEEGEIADETESQGTPIMRERKNIEHSPVIDKPGKKTFNNFFSIEFISFFIVK